MLGFLKKEVKEEKDSKPVEYIWLICRCRYCNKLLYTRLAKRRVIEFDLLRLTNKHSHSCCTNLKDDEFIYAEPVKITHDEPTGMEVITEGKYRRYYPRYNIPFD